MLFRSEAATAPKPVEKASTKHVIAPIVAAAETPKKRKASFAEKREYEALEGEIAALEAKKSVLEADLTSGAITDHVRLRTLAAEIETVGGQLEAKELRWLELAELV